MARIGNKARPGRQLSPEEEEKQRQVKAEIAEDPNAAVLPSQRIKRPELAEPQAEGIVDTVAKAGLYPAALIAKGIAPKINLIAGRKIFDENLSVDEIATQTRNFKPGGVPVGQGLGLTTAALGTYLGGQLGARFLGGKAVTSKIGGGGRVASKVRGFLGKGNVPRVSNAAIEREAARAGLTRAGVGQVKRTLGKMRVQEVANTLRSTQGGLLKRYVRGSLTTKRIGGAGLLAWLGTDNLSQSAAMQASALEDNVIFGQMSKSEALGHLDNIQTQNNTGKAALLAAAAVSPLAIPFLIFGWASASGSERQINKTRQIIESL